VLTNAGTEEKSAGLCLRVTDVLVVHVALIRTFSRLFFRAQGS